MQVTLQGAKLAAEKSHYVYLSEKGIELQALKLNAAPAFTLIGDYSRKKCLALSNKSSSAVLLQMYVYFAPITLDIVGT